ncbi:TetR family transcriptional regulator [Desulfoluna limicola]|uniref:TetR family transcriptional regulator n=1 Tax=Desulfoluna limicola TaxID=2810562 RepID=A0ABN6F4Q3_9BACT|nr:TetR/AcrR family transcriptional regulator [Desulfoluna limicola]BCS96941.1 TetR family transcriptional regulator [Desulfoluna limicola]
MPKAVRSAEEIEEIKDRILDTATIIIYEQGFDNLSMRKIASRLGMTAANIYNYYANQDELYLSIQIKGFTLYNDYIVKVYNAYADPVERLGKLLVAYLDFGIGNPGYYEIMLDSNTPRYTDYMGTKLEPLAYEAKQSALTLLGRAKSAIEAVAVATGRFPKEDASYLSLQLWSHVHGTVILQNRKIWKEVVDDPEALIKRMASDLMERFLGTGDH